MNNVIRWAIAGIILFVIALSIIGPTGVTKAFAALNDKFDIWGVDDPNKIKTPPNPIDNYKELNAAFVTKNKFTNKVISVNYMKELFQTPVCKEKYTINGDKTYLIQTKINNKDAFLIYVPDTFLGILSNVVSDELEDVDQIEAYLSGFISLGSNFNNKIRIERINDPINDIMNYCLSKANTKPKWDDYCKDTNFNNLKNSISEW